MNMPTYKLLPVPTAQDCDEIWRQRVAKSSDDTCPDCFEGKSEHSFAPDPWGGAVVLCKASEEEMLASHDRELAADLRNCQHDCDPADIQDE